MSFLQKVVGHGIPVELREHTASVEAIARDSSIPAEVRAAALYAMKLPDNVTLAIHIQQSGYNCLVGDGHAGHIEGRLR